MGEKSVGASENPGDLRINNVQNNYVDSAQLPLQHLVDAYQLPTQPVTRRLLYVCRGRRLVIIPMDY